MSVTTVKLKTHNRTDITSQYDLNNCTVHNRKPVILDIVAGRRKEHHYVAVCKDDDCGKISMDSGQAVVNIWNKWNP
jgi:hypothetical protein